ncbi:hypothetical protein HYH02_009565 [Chlamydomonas schloesseri]|uniref:Calponin-homology (CH) domain-containing protein n=1 Tax=Chlamydomonas schloesseri TaxID=2026947 RepID=A0A835TD03_9CHLO|nr:hypothetical protein HYH02_009565 [Chlamydomonas schloesseri]|eukprot:KAG2443154.1 hypothetical protein HYH02_009565 [Chlamydomonas schloesseri]
MDVAEHELQGLYTWVDEIPLSRPKRNIARDFSDGVLMAEVVHHFYPKLVELHNYSSANGLQQKMYNWNTLNAKVFKRLGFMVTKQDCEACCNCKPGAVERVLKLIKVKIAKYKEEHGDASPGVVAQASEPMVAYQQQMLPPQQQMPVQQQHPMMMARPAPGPAPGVVGAAMPMGVMAPLSAKMNAAMQPEIIAEKDTVIAELRETNQILETKVRKLEQLVRLKDAKIQTLMAKLQAAGMA